MRYVIFPSAYYPNETRPQIAFLFEDSNIEIINGPTESGLYIIEGGVIDIELLKFLAEPFYIIFQDFEQHLIH
jgi:hypothetical protein